MALSQPIYFLKRRARRMSRAEGIPLHEALDRVAREEGFRHWGTLAGQCSSPSDQPSLLRELAWGDLLLIGGRPGQGKTMASFHLAIEALRQGRDVVVFTLEYTQEQVERHLRKLGADLTRLAGHLRIDTSDDISAPYVARHLASARPGTVVVIDYLQLLDQRRENPPLAEQIAALRTVARDRSLIIECLSQVDRAFEATGRKIPGIQDVRLPNPVDLSLFTKVCFVHDQRVSFQ